MARVVIVLAAVAGLTLIVWLLSGNRPEDRTVIPAVNAPDVAIESEERSDPDIETPPPASDVSLEAEDVTVDVTREPVREDEPLEVTMPEGEGSLNVDETDDVMSDAETPGEGDRPEAGEEQAPDRQ